MNRTVRLIVGMAAAGGMAWTGGALGQTTHTVQLIGLDFVPPDLTVELGDTVLWDWVSGFHNVESGVGGLHDGNFRSGDPTGDDATTFEVLFDQAFLDANPVPDGEYPYYCIVHFGIGMSGIITVQVPATPGDLNGDGDVDLLDYSLLSNCISGPEGANPGGSCTPDTFAGSDLDEDGDVDLRDLATFQPLFQGS